MPAAQVGKLLADLTGRGLAVGTVSQITDDPNNLFRQAIVTSPLDMQLLATVAVLLR